MFAKFVRAAVQWLKRPFPKLSCRSFSYMVFRAFCAILIKLWKDDYVGFPFAYSVIIRIISSNCSCTFEYETLNESRHRLIIDSKTDVFPVHYNKAGRRQKNIKKEK